MKDTTTDQTTESKIFCSISMPLPGGGTRILNLDENAARDCLEEMETWGDDCSQSSKDFRAELRKRFNRQ